MPRRLVELPLLRRLKPGLYVHDEEALNAEPGLELLDEPITPIDAFFIRNNGALPEIDPAREWTLTIDGEVERPRVWTLPELRATFETVTLTAVIECAGNGRSQFSPVTDGLPWRLGAVGCARWTGVRLKDVLEHSGVKPSAVYTGHYAPDRQISDPAKPALSRGLPIAKALAPETLIAFGMNGEPLAPLHGAPLRIVAPGFPGSAWQKWLDRISLRPHEHDGEKMCGTNYRLPIVPVRPGEAIADSQFAVITDMPVKSLISHPTHGFISAVGSTLTVAGYAWSGSIPVESVRVSCDGGESWREAELLPGEGPFAWRRFTADFAIEKAGPLMVLAQARDRDGNVQPLDAAPWNPRGYCNNQVQRVSGAAR
ncbi:sulfite oxidase [Bosea lathyri]|uniref:Sulfite dehydrogenase (Cytochrome) subunit SorA apoprotein n=1 Tax=Bosea lathyri TaxID=1036778 RepID=A0A1H6DEL9_9HYPH|nr:sulfite oxidase [Bosea lathyri]SEG83163.1 sulfite dehydrogenase (cytochrome) subunit SorA apoprotein [Bosea lathyri]